MEFYTASSIKRPVRLPDAVREWAWESLHGKYGDEAIAHYAVTMDDFAGYETLPKIDQQDLAVLRIAERAPVRLCPEEKIAGSATLGLSIRHRIPAVLDGKDILGSTSHHTPNFRRALVEGMDSYQAEIETRLKDPSLSGEQHRFMASLLNTMKAMRIWHYRYLQATETARPDIHALLERVPFAPARSFHEAVQSLWFLFAFMRLCGNWPGIGRIDWLLGEYLERDLKNGTVTLDEAREILASLFIKGCE